MVKLFENCPICDEYVMYPHHQCPPAFRVWAGDTGETIAEARLIHAKDAGEAAEKWAEKALYGGWFELKEIDLNVLPADVWTEWSETSSESEEQDPASEVYTVTVEAVPSFNAVKKVIEP